MHGDGELQVVRGGTAGNAGRPPVGIRDGRGPAGVGEDVDPALGHPERQGWLLCRDGAWIAAVTPAWNSAWSIIMVGCMWFTTG
jgi:hypothetical protein